MCRGGGGLGCHLESDSCLFDPLGWRLISRSAGTCSMDLAGLRFVRLVEDEDVRFSIKSSTRVS